MLGASRKDLRMSTLAGIVLSLASCSLAYGQTVSHRIIGQDRGHVAIVSASGAVEWEVPCDFVSHDIGVLPNGSLLLHTGPATVVEMTPAKRIVWQYTSRPAPPY